MASRLSLTLRDGCHRCRFALSARRNGARNFSAPRKCSVGSEVGAAVRKGASQPVRSEEVQRWQRGGRRGGGQTMQAERRVRRAIVNSIIGIVTVRKRSEQEGAPAGV